MKIKATDGTKIDTNDMSDVEGMIIKKQQELYDICKKSNVPCYIITLITKGSIISSFSVKSKIKTFWNTLAGDIYERSSGRIALAYIQPPEEPTEDK